ncbi:MAG: GNAT family N-acetyltransferase [Pseudomonadota bacterium]
MIDTPDNTPSLEAAKTVLIRRLEEADRDRWQDLFRSYFEFYEVEVPENGFDRVWNWIFDPDNDFWCDLAVKQDGSIIGFVHYQLWHSSLTASMACYMADLFVEPSERGSGAGRLLVDKVLAFARDRDLPSVDWLTQDSNYAGRRLYDTYEPKSDFVFYSVPTRQECDP